MENKLTIEQFGAKIKEKYPQYAKFSDAEIGQKTLASYPEYQSKIASTQESKSSSSYLSNLTNSVGTDINNRVDKYNQIINNKDSGPITKGVQVFGQGAGLAANTLEQTVGQIPGVKKATEAVGNSINWLATSDYSPIRHLGNLIGSNETLQEVTHLYDTDSNFKNTVDAVANIARLGGDVSTIVDSANFAKNVTNKVISNVKPAMIKNISTVGDSINAISEVAENVANKGIIKDIIPTKKGYMSREVTQALDLTAGDVKNISKSTGNDVGTFVVDNNLIGSDVNNTLSKVKDFYKTNHSAVRDEIKKVTKIFDKNEIPAYKESLTEIKKQISDIPGLSQANSEVDQLINRTKMSLSDIQKAKELLDEHFSLYKATGDVKEGVSKTGLSKLRTELKSFIETNVKKSTGSDIRKLNNNVATSRSLMDAIETRSTRNFTRATISPSDIMTFLGSTGVSGGNPFVGITAVIAKKLYQSPTFKLRFSQFLEKLPSSKLVKVQSDLKKGVLPKEIKLFQESIDSNTSSNLSKNPKIPAASTPNTNSINPSSDFINQVNKATNKVTPASTNITSKRIIESSLPQEKSIVKKAVDKTTDLIKQMHNSKGGFVKLSESGKVIKMIDEATKNEIYNVVKYLSQDIKTYKFNKSLESDFNRLASKYEININKPLSQIVKQFNKLLDKTKTK